MRTIKFRAWDPKTKTLFFVSTVDFSEKSDRPLMQFTGLKDRNGKEIFEGDIVSVCNGSINGNEWMEKNYPVEFKDGKFNLHLFLWDNEGVSQMNSTHWIEVIGNIYENLELLKN